MKYDEAFLKSAHQYTSDHRKQLLESNLCGCFYCLETFKPEKIERWIDDNKTALCPRCEIDSVLGNGSIYGRVLPIDDKDFLKAMHQYWF